MSAQSMKVSAEQAVAAGVAFETWAQQFGDAVDLGHRLLWDEAEKQAKKAKQQAEWRAASERVAAKRAARLAEGWTEGPDGWIKPDGSLESPPWKEKSAGRLGALPLDSDDRSGITGAFRSGLMPGLNLTEKLVWLFLLSTASETPGRVVEASARYVGNGLGLPKSPVARALKKLTALTLIRLRTPGRKAIQGEEGAPARYFVERVTAARVSQWRAALNREAAQESQGEEE